MTVAVGGTEVVDGLELVGVEEEEVEESSELDEVGDEEAELVEVMLLLDSELEEVEELLELLELVELVEVLLEVDVGGAVVEVLVSGADVELWELSPAAVEKSALGSARTIYAPSPPQASFG